MATRLLNLQGVLFLNHNIQWLLLKYDDDRYLYEGLDGGSQKSLIVEIFAP